MKRLIISLFAASMILFPSFAHAAEEPMDHQESLSLDDSEQLSDYPAEGGAAIDIDLEAYGQSLADDPVALLKEGPHEEDAAASDHPEPLAEDMSASAGSQEQEEDASIQGSGEVEPASPLSDGVYVFRSFIADREVLDVTGNSTNAGANIETWSSNGGDNQKWEVVSQDDGTYTIKSLRSGLLLDVSGASSKPGANVIQWDDNGGANQRWRIVAGNGGWTIASALSENLVLDISGEKSADGGNIIVWTPTGGANQRWELIAAPVDVDADDWVDDGFYILEASDGVVLDIAGKSISSGGNVELWAANGGANQIFYVSTTEDGFITIENGKTGLFVSTTGSDFVPGSNVSQQGGFPSDSQLFAGTRTDAGWTFRNVANGLFLSASSASSGASISSEAEGCAFTLIPVAEMLSEGFFRISPTHSPSLVLDVSGNSVSQGANVIQYTSTGSFNQKWEVLAADGLENTYTIQSLQSGFYLADSEGNAVQLADGTDASCQWVPVPMGNSFSLKNVSSDLFLDVSGATTKAGGNVCTYAQNGNANQCFTFIEVPVVSEGTYLIRLVVDETVVVEVEGQSKTSGANVDGWTFNDGGNQKWVFSINSDGTYSIVNAKSKMALDISDGNVVQSTVSSSSETQHWIVSWNRDGSFMLLSAADPSVALTVGEGDPQSGDNAGVSEATASSAQLIMFEATRYFTSGNDTLDAILEAMVDRFGANGSTSLRAVYDWVATFPYTSMNLYPGGSWQSWSIPYAIEMYSNHTGNCYRYASLTCWFARALGYEAKTVSGQVLVSSGWAAHGWVEINQGGKIYIIDTSQHRAAGSRNFFMVDYDSAPLYYRKLS